MFVNRGEFEVLAVQKIIGSIGGGVVVTKNSNFYKFAKKEQMKNKDLGKYQSRRKFEEFNKKKHSIHGFIMKAGIHFWNITHY